MTPKDFVTSICEEVVDSNIGAYGQMLALPPNTVKDASWRRACEAYQAMDSEQQAVIRNLIKATVVDTVSNILGILGRQHIVGKSQRCI